MKITARRCRRMGACYDDMRLQALFPRSRTLREVFTLKSGHWKDVSMGDRVWVATCSNLLPPAILVQVFTRSLQRMRRLFGDKSTTLEKALIALRRGNFSAAMLTRLDKLHRMRLERYRPFSYLSRHDCLWKLAKLAHIIGCTALMPASAEPARVFTYNWLKIQKYIAIITDSLSQRALREEHKRQIKDLLKFTPAAILDDH